MFAAVTAEGLGKYDINARGGEVCNVTIRACDIFYVRSTADDIASLVERTAQKRKNKKN